MTSQQPGCGSAAERPHPQGAIRRLSATNSDRFPACARPRLWQVSANSKMGENEDMALQAYPDVPLFRYPWTALTEAQIAAKLAPAAQGGPGSKGGLETDLAGTTLRVVTDGAGTLTWQFGQGNRVTFDGATGGYGALTQDHVTLISHVVPNSTKAWAIAWDRHSNLATVFELWWGGGPAPHTREINRAVWHGYVATEGPAPSERHAPTLRMEGRAYAWTEDTGMRTVEYYPSVTYTHWVELDRLKEGRGYSAPADYVMLTEDLYLFARVEAEFSGMVHMYVLDANRLEQVGLRLGFNGADDLEFYLFRGTGEWLGQNARFEALGDFSANPIPIPNAKKRERRIYRPLATMDKMTPAEVDAAVAASTHVFDRPSRMAGNGTPPSGALATRSFAVDYDDGPTMEYRFVSNDLVQWRKDGQGDWRQ